MGTRLRFTPSYGPEPRGETAPHVRHQKAQRVGARGFVLPAAGLQLLLGKRWEMLINSYLTSSFGEQKGMTAGAVGLQQSPSFPGPYPDPCSTLGLRTPVLQQFAPVDLVLHHVSPVQRALVEVEVQGDGVAQPGHQDAVIPAVQIDATDLVAVGEDDERFERVWGAQGGLRRGGGRSRGTDGPSVGDPLPHIPPAPHPPCPTAGSRPPVLLTAPEPKAPKPFHPPMSRSVLQDQCHPEGVKPRAPHAHPWHPPRLRQLSPSGSSIQPS